MAFNLDKSLLQWKKALRRHKGFEEGYIAELEDHFRERFSELLGKGCTEEEAFRQIMDLAYMVL